jgi:hypothetical protein
MRKAALLLTVVFLAGCTARYNVANLSGSAALTRDRGVYITIPQDAAYGSQKYAGSGQMVAHAVAGAFSKHAAKVHIAEKRLSHDEALITARQSGAGYLIVPTIAHWEHRATEWSMRPSRMIIRLSVIDAANGSELAATSSEGRSRIISWTSTSPESLLRDPLDQYVGNLYQK